MTRPARTSRPDADEPRDRDRRPAHPFGSDATDAELVRRACEGDSWGQEVLFRRYVRDVTQLCTRLMGRREDADDVVQDAFAEALRDMGRLRDPDAFRSWLMRIAVNRCRKTYRRRKLSRALGLDRGYDDASLTQLGDRAASPETLVELELLDQVLRRLPTDQRIAWMLRHVEGETLEAVAELTGCSLATAKRRIDAGQVVLRAHVERRAS
jgi:RNA polymerase sigma-70 factor (ECF subfamily)